ncbi:hypothetical protein ACOYW6_00270 [Parablastomonas sp. CN1-191]|uniref:hypothetical protein n=1 Tax=Parablastomonas sp. CN1-191 TaxID=3400908 RepID=UPI003BF8B61C
MDLDDVIRHFFETDDPTALTEAEFAAGLERLRIGFGVEREPSRKFALWTLLDALGSPVPPAEAFEKEPALRDAANRYLDQAWKVERRGEDGA